MPDLPHELAITPDRTCAYVPAYGDGIHGDNPHPNHLVCVIDLATFARAPDIDLAPLEAPHTLRFAADGKLYIACENSARIAVYDPKSQRITSTFATRSSNSHRLCVLSRLGLVCTENEEDASVSFIDIAGGELADRLPLGHALAGIDACPDETVLVVSNAEAASLTLIDPRTRQIGAQIRLTGHARPAQVVRYSPDGRWLLVIGDHEPVVTLISTATHSQTTIGVGTKPMDGAFHPDGRTLLVANEKDGTLSEIDLEALTVRRTVLCGEGCETLAYF
ncbi:YncE family protein [Novosphingobium profundi]|uniref:YncE family protein n=1 Tax=Novosphingobium profundi TaxID=1774954 RepID=UPI001BD9D912|nr:hypothetical protein [Novosphingobium profundi]